MTDSDELIDSLKAHYGAVARKAAAAKSGAVIDECCGTAESGCAPVTKDSVDVFGAVVYDPSDLSEVPEEAVAASVGCANPVALARLEAGEDVLDLGSGGGIDVLLSARRVGPHGRAYGIDMTDEMLELARANQAKAGVSNVEFRRGRIEDVPLPDSAVDVIVSNCVINLSPDKDAVFAEAYRLLRPGGRLAIADVVAETEPDPNLLVDDAAWSACTAGAVTRDRYRQQLHNAGFVDVRIVESHGVADGYSSVFVHANKPAAMVTVPGVSRPRSAL